MGNPEKAGECLGMTIILMQWVLEAILLAKQTLRPLATFLVSKNPAFHVLVFDDEDAEAWSRWMLEW